MRSRLTTLTFDDMVQAQTDEYESHHVDNAGSGKLTADGGAHNAIDRRSVTAATAQRQHTNSNRLSAATCAARKVTKQQILIAEAIASKQQASGARSSCTRLASMTIGNASRQNKPGGSSNSAGGGGTAQHIVNFSFDAE